MNIENLISSNTVGLLYMPADYEIPRKGLFALWRRNLVAGAEIRNRDYMKELFKCKFPGCQIVEVEPVDLPDDVLEQVENVVLLFVDSIGLDCSWMERAIATRWPQKRVLVLNGRRRFFRLDTRMHRRLSFRRFLEKFRFMELALFLIFIVITPFLLFLDIIRDHR